MEGRGGGERASMAIVKLFPTVFFAGVVSKWCLPGVVRVSRPKSTKRVDKQTYEIYLVFITEVVGERRACVGVW